MKRQSILLAATVALTVTTAWAQTPDTLRFDHPHSVEVISTDSSLCVAVVGADNQLVNKSLTLNRAEAVASERFDLEWGFNLPIGKKKKTENNNPRSLEIQAGSLRLGFNTALANTPHLNTNMGASWEIGIGCTALNIQLRNRRSMLSAELWLNWKNFRMTDDYRFLKTGQSVQLAPYPDEADIKFSRLKFFTLQFPFMYHYTLGRDWRVAAGPVVNLNTHASLKTRYTLPSGDKVKETSNHINPQILTVDLQTILSYRSYSLYAKYSPCHQLRTAGGAPKFSGISSGIILFY